MSDLKVGRITLTPTPGPWRVTPAPTPSQRLVELLVSKFGSLKCRHTYVLMIHQSRMFLRCDQCGLESEGFRVAGREDV